MAALAPLAEVLAERLALQPLEHEVGDPHAGLGGERADVERLDDARRGPREPVQDPPLAPQRLEQRVALGGVERGR
ncbi:hypothetical protein, partial [Aeromonas sp. EERV15]|uniref:hypothetical protein n=1 Tax=Aeromonas sp. EERV15 TaxID=1833892 RepID=UPI001C400AA0